MLYLRISIFILHFFSERHHDAMPFIYFYVKKYFIFREKKHLLHAKKIFFHM